MIYAKGWFELLGYRDDEITMLDIVSTATPRFAPFLSELNDKALNFINNVLDNLEDYSFTTELEKNHKNGNYIPLFTQVGVYKSVNGKIDQIIGISHKIIRLKLGAVMQYAVYVPEISKFEEILSQGLFQYYAISRKEKEVLLLASQGYVFKEISIKLGLTHSAIEKRIIPMYKKFKVRSLTHLISFAHSNNII